MSTIEKIQEEVLVEEAVGVNGEFNQEALKEITSIKDNIITLYLDYGTGASMEH